MNEYDDEQGCEIIDVIWSCAQFKKDLIESEPKKIQGELKLSLEELTRLSGHDKIDDAGDDLKKVVEKVIYIKKISNYMSGISDYGVDWYKEYYEETGDKSKVNPVRLIANVGGNSDKIGFDCSKQETELKEWQSYFDECDQTTKFSGSGNAKVVRVLKPIAYRSDKGGGYFVPYEKGGTSGRDNKELKSDLKTKHSKDISSKGKLGELIVETCDQYQSGLWSIGKDSFCKEILQKFFEIL